MFAFVDGAVAAGQSVLIHCVAGAHRAGTTACAYLMHKNRALSASQAIAVCKRRRPVVDPAISNKLVQLLHQLHAAHTKAPATQPQQPPALAALTANAAANGSGIVDLDAEGWKILEALSHTPLDHQ